MRPRENLCGGRGATGVVHVLRWHGEHLQYDDIVRRDEWHMFDVRCWRVLHRWHIAACNVHLCLWIRVDNGGCWPDVHGDGATLQCLWRIHIVCWREWPAPCVYVRGGLLQRRTDVFCMRWNHCNLHRMRGRERVPGRKCAKVTVHVHGWLRFECEHVSRVRWKGRHL